jgi:hypothetical protein
MEVRIIERWYGCVIHVTAVPEPDEVSGHVSPSVLGYVYSS